MFLGFRMRYNGAMSDNSKKPIGLILEVEAVEVHHPDCPHSQNGQESGGGPAKVTSDAYRSGWDSVFGSKMPVGQA